jgi:hypothetical protein
MRFEHRCEQRASGSGRASTVTGGDVRRAIVFLILLVTLDDVSRPA